MTTGAYQPRSRSGSGYLAHGLNRHRGLRPHQLGRRYRRLRHGDTGPCERESCLCCDDIHPDDYHLHFDHFECYERPDDAPDPEVLLSAWREGVAFTAARARIAHCMPTALARGPYQPIAPRERAESVGRLLVKFGVPQEHIRAEGFGQSQLRVQTQHAERQNRRVQFFVTRTRRSAVGGGN